MNRRHGIYLGLIALLVALNFGRWWLPAATEAGASAARSPFFLPQDFRLRTAPSVVRAAPLRDLFQPADGAAIRATPPRSGSAVGKTVKAARAAEPAQVQVQPVAAEALVDVDVEVAAADAELGRLKLLGVVFHAGKGRAYLALDRENIIALAGDTVFGRFAVDKVAVDAVDLRELKTNTSRRIPVSGK
jgi:hypothetical protein